MNPNYVLVTAARNEAKLLRNTIESLLSQTVLPAKWVLISDGSTDQTDEIMYQYAEQVEFIEYLRIASTEERNFCSKVYALEQGYKRVINLDFAFFGVLDADVTMAADYYEQIFSEFDKNPELGIAGGLIRELRGQRYISQNLSLNSVAGAVQLFRRQCYDEIGGYMPLKMGGVDTVAEVKARMLGWEVRTFHGIEVNHHRLVGKTRNRFLGRFINDGKKYHLLGYHPMFFVLRSLYRIIDPPYVIGSLLRLYGYFFSSLGFHEKPVSYDFVKFLQSEQWQRMKSLIRLGKNKANIQTTRTIS